MRNKVAWTILLCLAVAGCAFATTVVDPYVTLTTASSGTSFSSLPITFTPLTPNQNNYFTNNTGAPLSSLLVTATTPASNPYVYPAFAYACNPGVAIPFSGTCSQVSFSPTQVVFLYTFGTPIANGVSFDFITGPLNSGGMTYWTDNSVMSVTNPVPEPGTLALAGTGVLMVAGLLRRKLRV